MEYISTSALANELDIKSADLFDKLKTLGWIERKNDKWTLTDLGKQKGGPMGTGLPAREAILITMMCGSSVWTEKHTTADYPT